MNKNFFLLFLFSLLILTSCDKIIRGPGSPVYHEEIFFNTSDGYVLSADYYHSDSEKGLLLLHMMGKTKESYRSFAPTLAETYQVMAIDFRGHGKSDGDFTTMVEREFEGLQKDVEAAMTAFELQGIAPENVSIVGASIGANAALIYASEHPVDKLVLLAPGSTYRGLDISRISYKEPLLAQVGYYDAYAYISVDELQTNWDKGRVMQYDTSAHGSDLLHYDLSAREDFYFYLT